jgi:hypothetical protein
MTSDGPTAIEQLRPSSRAALDKPASDTAAANQHPTHGPGRH